jgi:tetratricopeptide (TPR) repeat protein
MAEIEGQFGWKEIGAYLSVQAGAYYDRGYQKGENSALLISIEACHEALKELTRERAPLEWAATQNNLGNALCSLGERGYCTGKLEEAVAAYCEALKELTRERAPLEWARTQMNLGAALCSLGERKARRNELEEAAIRVACCQFIALCRQLGLFAHAVAAIDGSKFKAVNARDKNFTTR